MDLKQQRDAALTAARDIAEKAKNEGRDLTEDETSTIEAKLAEADDLKGRIAQAAKSADLFDQLATLGTPDDSDDEPAAAKSLGEHFVKAVGTDGLARVKTTSGAVVAAPEWTPQVKQPGDHSTPGSLAPWLTTFDRAIVRAFRRPVVSDLFGQGTLGANSNAVTYLVEGSVEGALATVAEGGSKPQFQITDPTQRTDALKKIAGFLKFTDEMVEDADFWVSEINQRGIYLLALAEEAQLLTGNGTGSNIEGLLQRSGVQTESAANTEDNADALFRAMSKVQTATGLSADGVVINPVDYERLRLGKDGNGQYFGGGYFTGPYGNGDVEWQPPVWGRRTIVSAAVAAGTAIVGAFGAGATVYRKGGVRVESTNSHASDFTSNLITTRIEERVALAVRIPAAFVNVSLAAPTAPA
jgi:HK97 family phage major capsid protein